MIHRRSEIRNHPLGFDSQTRSAGAPTPYLVSREVSRSTVYMINECVSGILGGQIAKGATLLPEIPLHEKGH